MAINIFLTELLKKSTRGGANLPPNQNKVNPNPFFLVTLSSMDSRKTRYEFLWGLRKMLETDFHFISFFFHSIIVT